VKYGHFLKLKVSGVKRFHELFLRKVIFAGMKKEFLE
jgi:hypothetical protein